VIYLWDITAGRQVGSYRIVDRKSVDFLAWYRDYEGLSNVAACGLLGEVTCLDPRTGALRARVQLTDGKPLSAFTVLSSDESPPLAVAAIEGGPVRVSHLSNGLNLTTLHIGRTAAVRSMACLHASRVETMLLLAMADGALEIWDPFSGVQKRCIPLGEQVHSVAAVSENRICAAISDGFVALNLHPKAD
jgi:hypothetical protein